MDVSNFTTVRGNTRLVTQFENPFSTLYVKNQFGLWTFQNRTIYQRRCNGYLEVVPTEGVEPTHPYGYQILSLARLPIPPRRHVTPEYILSAAEVNKFQHV